MFKKILIAVFLVVGNFYLFAKELPHRILIINSYHTGLSWTDSLNKGFINAVRGFERPVEVFIENLDTKRFPENLHSKDARNYIVSRIKQINPALIALTDDNAVILMESLIKENFGFDTIPVVFMGVNQERAFPKNFTGILEGVDIKANFEFIKQLQPKVQRVYCVTDDTTTGKVIGDRINNTLIKYNPGFEVLVLGNCSYYELIDTLSTLTENDAILFLLFNRDSRGNYFSYEAILDSLRRSVKAPIYGTWSFYLNHGIVGGAIISGCHHGMRSGELANLLLKGVSPKTIAPADGPFDFIVDYMQLARYSISEKSLPEGILLINKEQSFIPLSRGTILVLAAIALLLVMLLIFMGVYSRMRNKALRLQKYYNTLLEQQNQEVENSLRLVEEANELKSAFLANMSHEIRTPMNAIVGFSKLVKESSVLSPEEVNGYLDIIEENAQRLMRLINDIIDISKIDSKQLSIYKRPVQLGHLFANCYRAAEVELDRVNKNNIAIEMSFRPTDAALEVVTDPDRLQQVIMNLLNNAIKFTNSGRIVLGYSVIHDILRVSVEDTGIGIDPQHLGAVFERFRQIDGTLNREYGGSGLGLSICKGIVEAMGGRIGVDSRPEVGSTFWFEIPISLASPGQLVEVPVKASKSKLKNKVLLIVEDNEPSDLLLRQMLKGTGAVLLQAATGKEVATILDDKVKIDIALVDVYLPDMSGYEVVSRIKHAQPHVKVIAQTANAMDTDRQKSIDAGCDDHITKPIDKEKLIELLSRLLS
ncbi:MAG TPA: response regulator [Bacteroidales bacterium]|nr:response regulator [Bacteroidales bacterium]